MYLGDFKSFKTSKAGSIDDCVNTWCTKKRIWKTSLPEWQTTVTKHTDNKIARLKNSSVFHKARKNSKKNYKIRKTLHQKTIYIKTTLWY